MEKRERLRLVKRIDKLVELFDGGEGWTRNELATDELGYTREVDEKDACKFCLYGGIMRVTKNQRTEDQLFDLIDDKTIRNYNMRLTAFNDSAPSFTKVENMLLDLKKELLNDSTKK